MTTHATAKYPHVKIRKVSLPGGAVGFAIRWVQKLGAKPHRAVLLSIAMAEALRDAVKHGENGWLALDSLIRSAIDTTAAGRRSEPAIPTAEVGEPRKPSKEDDPEWRRQRARNAALARHAKLTPEQRSAIAAHAATAKYEQRKAASHG